MGTQALRAVLLLAHLAAAAVWLGGMAYSLAIVQPRARRFLGGAERYEGFATALAAGARHGVLGLIALLAASGTGLVAVELAGASDPGTTWAVLVAADRGDQEAPHVLTMGVEEALERRRGHEQQTPAWPDS